MAIHLRETIFNSTILLNAETWVNVTKSDEDELESVDKILLRNILETPISTPIPALYLELGRVPLRFKIQAKTILYLHTLIIRNDSEVTSQVLEAQINDPVSVDWTESVQKDLIQFNLNHLSFETIKNIKKENFINIVKKACCNAAFDYLLNMKKSKGPSI